MVGERHPLRPHNQRSANRKLYGVHGFSRPKVSRVPSRPNSIVRCAANRDVHACRRFTLNECLSNLEGVSKWEAFCRA
jgi:hypothetical protein